MKRSFYLILLISLLLPLLISTQEENLDNETSLKTCSINIKVPGLQRVLANIFDPLSFDIQKLVTFDNEITTEIQVPENKKVHILIEHKGKDTSTFQAAYDVPCEDGQISIVENLICMIKMEIPPKLEAEKVSISYFKDVFESTNLQENMEIPVLKGFNYQVRIAGKENVFERTASCKESEEAIVQFDGTESSTQQCDGKIIFEGIKLDSLSIQSNENVSTVLNVTNSHVFQLMSHRSYDVKAKQGGKTATYNLNCKEPNLDIRCKLDLHFPGVSLKKIKIIPSNSNETVTEIVDVMNQTSLLLLRSNEYKALLTQGESTKSYTFDCNEDTKLMDGLTSKITIQLGEVRNVQIILQYFDDNAIVAQQTGLNGQVVFNQLKGKYRIIFLTNQGVREDRKSVV